MTPDVHAAAERLRKHAEAITGGLSPLSEHSVYCRDDKWDGALFDEDRAVIVHAYLAEHPADAVTFTLHIVMFGEKPILFTESLATAKGRIGVSWRSKQTSRDGLRIETVSVSVPKEIPHG